MRIWERWGLLFCHGVGYGSGMRQDVKPDSSSTYNIELSCAAASSRAFSVRQLWCPCQPDFRRQLQRFVGCTPVGGYSPVSITNLLSVLVPHIGQKMQVFRDLIHNPLNKEVAILLGAKPRLIEQVGL